MYIWVICACEVGPRFPHSFKLYVKAKPTPAFTVTKIQTLLQLPDSNVTDTLFLKVLFSQVAELIAIHCRI